MGQSTFGKIGLAALCVAIILLVRGDIALAAIAVLAVLVLRVFILIADVFWTSFTGKPLVRARHVPPSETPVMPPDGSDVSAPVGPFARLSSLPMPLRRRAAPRVSLFTKAKAEAEPPSPSRRLKARKARMGYQ